MGKCLLSVDWDYFIYTQKENWGSYLENTNNVVNLWYKRYILAKSRGKDIQSSFRLSDEADGFWDKIRSHFIFEDGAKVYVSDRHTLSYSIAGKHRCNEVYLFDAHSDLGYGGPTCLDFEVNCANWLGKLLKDGCIAKAHIIYSANTAEKPEYFMAQNKSYDICYPDFEDLDTDIRVSAVHICRSGAWTPPWFDERFSRFVEELGIPYELIDCPPRKWDTSDISFADQIYYLMA